MFHTKSYMLWYVRLIYLLFCDLYMIFLCAFRCIIDHEKCLDNPTILECEYSANGACSFYFSTTTFWTLGYCGMLIFFVCLPCCLYHKCGIDWDSEFSLMSLTNNNNQSYNELQQSDGYIFKGGAPITGRCMYGSFLCIGFLFALIAIFGTILSISCLDAQY